MLPSENQSPKISTAKAKVFPVPRVVPARATAYLLELLLSLSLLLDVVLSTSLLSLALGVQQVVVLLA
jgi:hypothetical protein